MSGTLSARTASLGLHRSGREWRGNCPSCAYSNRSLVARAEIARERCRDELTPTAVPGRYAEPSKFVPGIRS